MSKLAADYAHKAQPRKNINIAFSIYSCFPEVGI
ncbi:Hypothetical protein TFLO_896 [Trichococcus flocculiformis]|jgi:hypothetical protein|uniref:Uncharacterized protein n=2 Tax=Trichococcus TaxID=82802 RepID=A0A143Z6W9_9LACT|nr:Hypothetical protein TFLO_896 [Trichococcus flocculiformis]CZR09044.1 Hypothetical protein TR210_2664 [Trichococcus ilyis]